MIKIIKERMRACGWGWIILAVLMTIFAGSKPPSPPTVVEKGIKLTTFSAPITGGMTIGWETEDDRIVLGEDEFIVEYQDRQIPSRTGWSMWREAGRTKTTNFHADGFWRNRDVRLRIRVDKGAIAK
jgi:hypothetical protein